MKKFKKIIASLMMVLSLIAITPVTTHAEWKQDSNGWWNTEGSSWSVGWKEIDGKWYYFNSDGYMAHDEYIGDYYLNSNGVWVTNISTQNTNSNNSSATTNESAKGERTVYWVDGGKSYHYNKNCPTLTRSKNIQQGKASECPKTDPCDKCVK